MASTDSDPGELAIFDALDQTPANDVPQAEPISPKEERALGAVVISLAGHVSDLKLSVLARLKEAVDRRSVQLICGQIPKQDNPKFK